MSEYWNRLLKTIIESEERLNKLIEHFGINHENVKSQREEISDLYDILKTTYEAETP